MHSIHSLRPVEHDCEDWASSAPLAQLNHSEKHSEALQLCESSSQLGLKSFSDVCDGGEHRANNASISHQEAQHSVDGKFGAATEGELPSLHEAKLSKLLKSGRRSHYARNRTRGDGEAPRIGERSIASHQQLIPAQLMSPTPPAQHYASTECLQCDFMTFMNRVRVPSLRCAAARVGHNVCVAIQHCAHCEHMHLNCSGYPKNKAASR